MLTLYYAKGTAALPPHIILEEIGKPYELQRLDFASGDQRSERYLAINPKGRVPTLITPEGTLTETPAILAYLAQTNPDAGLAPADPFAFAEAQAFNCYLASTVHVAHAHKLRGVRWADDEAARDSMRAKVAENMAECARLIEAHFFRGPWVLGEAFSICDPYLFLIGGWLPGDGVDIDRFQKIKAHRDAMLARPAVARVMELHT